MAHFNTSAITICSSTLATPPVCTETWRNFEAGKARLISTGRQVYDLPIYQFRLALHFGQVFNRGACFRAHSFPLCSDYRFIILLSGQSMPELAPENHPPEAGFSGRSTLSIRLGNRSTAWYLNPSFYL